MPEFQTKKELENFIKSIYQESFSEFQTNSEKDFEQLFSTLYRVNEERVEEWEKTLESLIESLTNSAMEEMSKITSERINDVVKELTEKHKEENSKSHESHRFWTGVIVTGIIIGFFAIIVTMLTGFLPTLITSQVEAQIAKKELESQLRTLQSSASPEKAAPSAKPARQR